MKILLDQYFADIDELSETVRAWDGKIRQLESGRFKSYALQIGFENTLVTHAVFDGKNHQYGNPPDGFRTFVILAGPDHLIWRGIKASKNTVMQYPTGGEHDAVTWQKCAVFTLSFSDTYLAKVGQYMESYDFENLFGKKEIIEAEPTSVQRLRGLLHQLCNGPLKNSQDSSKLNSEIEFELARRLLSTFVLSQKGGSYPLSRNRDRALKRVLDYLAEYSSEPHTVRDICRVAQVSERTLRYAFSERFGVSPKSYLLALRLSGANRDLRNNTRSHTTVTEVATRWGFWHLGQFATDYRRLFGKLPSETLGTHSTA